MLLSLALFWAAHLLAMHMKKSGGLPLQPKAATQMIVLSNPVSAGAAVQI